MRKFFVASAVILLSTCLTANAVAQFTWSKAVSPSDTYRIDGNKYHRNSLTADFVKIAYPRYRWFETSPFWNTHFNTSVATGSFLKYDRHLFQNIPWAQEYIARTEGHPAFDGLSKWHLDEIGIAFGWPPATDRDLNSIDKQAENQYEQTVKPHINAIKDSITEATGIPLKLVARESENQESYARIRFVMYPRMSHRNHFKKEPVEEHVMQMRIANIDYFHEDLRDAVRFTPLARAQADGYLLTDKGNRLGLAVCMMSQDLPLDLMKSVATECLLRSMGLPEMSELNENAALGYWNRAYDAYSERYILDGPTKQRGKGVRVDCKSGFTARGAKGSE